MTKPPETREQFLIAATRLFSERGFYGVSLAAVAEELGLTKQALIHHFGTKERLYGAVLERISQGFLAEFERLRDGAASPEAQLRAYLAGFCARALAAPQDTRLILRELMDNKQRAEQADRWYLKPFLAALIEAVRRTDPWREASEAEALAAIYQFLGAVSYFAVSEPTLARMFGDEDFAGMKRAFPEVLEQTAAAVFGDATQE